MVENDPAIPEPSARQIRAARAFFKWTQAEAAGKFGIYVDTLRDVETGGRTQDTKGREPWKATVRSIGAALAAHGVSFDEAGNMTLPR